MSEIKYLEPPAVFTLRVIRKDIELVIKQQGEVHIYQLDDRKLELLAGQAEEILKVLRPCSPPG